MSNDDLIIFLKSLFQSLKFDSCENEEFKERVRIQLNSALRFGGYSYQYR